MSYNINGTEISVFPLAKNRPSDRSSRIFYENNVANIIRQIIDVEGFLISSDTDASCVIVDSTTVKLKLVGDLVFNLYGYYFSIKSGATLYKCSNLDTAAESTTIQLSAALRMNDITQEIFYGDEEGEYKGLYIYETNNTSTHPATAMTAENGWHCIDLCTCELRYNSTDNWYVHRFDLNDASFKKISSASLDQSIRIIDGKH